MEFAGTHGLSKTMHDPLPGSWIPQVFHVFSRIPRLWGLSGGPLYTLFHVYSDKSGPMGEALFKLFAVFLHLFGQGAGVP